MRRASRREFLTTAAVIGAPLLVSPRAARGSAANSRLTLGVIGCGGRGTWIADLFQKHGGCEIRAAQQRPVLGQAPPLRERERQHPLP